MRSILLAIFTILVLTIGPIQTKAMKMPCSMILEPIDKILTNAKGAAIVYKVQLAYPSFPRTNISVLAVHLPNPANYGDFDRYEGIAFIPGEISWRFRLYPTPEVDGPT